MAITIKGSFPSRREAELLIEHLVQEYGIQRTDVFVEPVGPANSSGERPAGADAESGHPETEPDAGGSAYTGALSVSVDVNDDEVGDLDAAFREAGATEVVRG